VIPKREHSLNGEPSDYRKAKGNHTAPQWPFPCDPESYRKRGQDNQRDHSEGRTSVTELTLESAVDIWIGTQSNLAQ
jgi:hypothetical protein